MYNQKEFPQDLRNKDLVYDLYINQKLSKKDLGEKFFTSLKFQLEIIQNLK